MPPIIGSITITMNPDGSFTLDPATGLLNRHAQVMQWTLVAPEGHVFADPGGIVVNRHPTDPKVAPWPGEDPVRENNWQYRANVKHQVPHGAEPQRYHYSYDVVDARGLHHRHPVDPDMENMPQP